MDMGFTAVHLGQLADREIVRQKKVVMFDLRQHNAMCGIIRVYKKPTCCDNSRGHSRNLVGDYDVKSISRTPSIYQIRHIESGKVYVGSAIDPRTRCRKHRNALIKGKHHAPYLQHAWDKYGETAFVFEIIEPVLFVEDLIAREQYWIDTLRSNDPAHGYNLAPTAGSSLGYKHTDETRANMSKQAKARTADPQWRAEQSARAKAQMADPSMRAKVSARATAQFADPAERAAQSARIKATHADPEFRARQSERAKARFADPVEREKHSVGQKARYADPVEREKASAQAKARWTPEYRARRPKTYTKRGKVG